MGKNGFTFTGVIVKQGKGYSSLCLELDVASQGNTTREAKDALIEAAALYLESAIENNSPYLRPVPPDEDPRRTSPKLIVQTFQLRVNVAVRAYA
jgi:predicted RNase H-like HicB family nuclease